jgi:hypothetical protein
VIILLNALLARLPFGVSPAVGSNRSASHSNESLPIIAAGGGFKHGQHLAFNENKNAPLPNQFVSILQRLGVESDRFASSTGTLTGLEMA